MDTRSANTPTALTRLQRTAILVGMNASGRDYALGGTLIVIAAAALSFLSGQTAVFTGIAAAIGGAVLILRAVQANNDSGQDLRQRELDANGFYPEHDLDSEFDSNFDWDAHYQRDLGRHSGGRFDIDGPGEPR